MIQTEKSVFIGDSLSKNVQPPVSAELSEGALLLEVLKTMETQLQKKGFLKSSAYFNPLWFAAETERNVFLWRHQYSLDQKNEFEFWVNIDKLIDKRLAQIALTESDFQFVNPVWGLTVPNRETAEKEAEYLMDFADTIGKLQSHAHALSHVGLIIEREMLPDSGERPRIVLPV